jgi:peptide/nickel transport system substrate-binding protein
VAVAGLFAAACSAPAPAASPTAAPAAKPTAVPTGAPVQVGGGQPTQPPAAKPTTAPAATTQQPLQHVTIVYPLEFESRNPYGQSGQQGYAFWQHVYDPLLKFDDAAEQFVPVLAQSWDTPDNSTWVFHLNPAAKFADGSPVTAADVVASFGRITNDPESKQTQTTAQVKSITALDDHTVEFKTDGVVATLLINITQRVIQKKAYVDQVGTEKADREPLGSGPYKMVEWLPGQRVVLEKRSDYWGKGLNPDPHPTYTTGLAPMRVIYRFMAEPEARVTALLNGEVDVITRIPPQLKSRVESSSAARLESVPGERHMYFILNPITDSMKKVEVRQAIYHAIDVDGLVEGPLQGDAFKLEGPLAPNVFSFTPDLPEYPYDPAKTKALLAQAGYPDGVSVNMVCPNGQYPKDKETCEASAAMMTQAGIKTNLQFKEWGTYSTEYRKQPAYEMYLIGSTPTAGDPTRQYDKYFQCGVDTRTTYCNEAVTTALRKQQETLDQNERALQFQIAWKEVMKDPPAVFLYTFADNYAANSKVDWVPDQGESIFATRMQPKK